MRLGIKGKQVVGVTSLVAVIVLILSLWHLAALARTGLEESQARARLLADAIYHRARAVVVEGVDPYEALRADSGLRSILEASLYSKNVTFAMIADVHGVAIVHADTSQEGRQVPHGADLNGLLSRGALTQLAVIYSGSGRNLEVTQPLLLGNTEVGSIRIGVSTLLIRQDLNASLRPAASAAVIALAVALLVATLLAQLLLKPIHVIRSGLTRLERGELGVHVDLDQDDEFGELGQFFNTLSARLSADRSQMAGQVANLESAVEHLEDAVAMLSPRGEVLFANPAMRALLPGASPGVLLNDLVAAGHPVRDLAERTLATRQSLGPIPAFNERRSRDGVPAVSPEEGKGERLIITHTINDPAGELVGVIVIARNLAYLGQVQSTLRYSRKLVELGRLSAGVAHEVKNPLNAMMIHLELLRQQFQAAPAEVRGRTTGLGISTAVVAAPPLDAAAALKHVDVIAGEIRRLDQVVQDFLKFSRPEDLTLQPVSLKPLLGEVLPIVRPEASRTGVTLEVECPAQLAVNGDPAALRQAFLNLALNACQAMSGGGTLQIRCEPDRANRVAVSFSDTGIGIKPEHLSRIFDLYFTTKSNGSGIGLSMVYRTIQMHDGEIEVQSIPGAGSTFKVLLPQAG
jgi:signal transduction histidine kinase